MSNVKKPNGAVYKPNGSIRPTADGCPPGEEIKGLDSSTDAASVSSENPGRNTDQITGKTPAPKRNRKTRDDRPYVRIQPNEPSATLKELEAKLREQHQSRMYLRGTDAVYLCHLPEESSQPDVKSSINLIPATPDSVMTYFESIFRFQTKDKTGRWRNCGMPRWLAQRFLALPDRTGLPVLKGLAPCPTLRPDGSLLSKPGYDAKTRLYLTDSIDVTVSDNPTEQEARTAFDTMRAFLSTFPFAGKEQGDQLAESVAIASIIGSILRPCLPTIPATGVTAPTRGSGKSYVTNVIAKIVTGRTMPSVTIDSRLDEFEKRLGAMLRKAYPVICIGNLEVALKGALLAEAITEPDVRIRVLGRSEMVQISPTTAIFATGNNLQIHGDLTRRFLICELDAGMERPEERKFSRDPLAEASNRRGELISAALTIARYGLSLDPRDHGGGFPGFQDWYRRVAMPLVALGMPDPVKSLDLARATDEEQDALDTLMKAWWALFGDAPKTCRQVVDMPNDNLREALPAVACDKHGEPCSRALGYYLKRMQNRPVSGKRFVRSSRSAEGVMWQLVNAKGKLS